VRLQQTRVTQILLVWLLLELVAAAQVPRDGGSLLAGWLTRLGTPVAVGAQVAVNLVGDMFWGLRDGRRLLARSHEQQMDLELCQADRHLLREDLAALREAVDLHQATPLLTDPALVARCTSRDLGRGLMQVSAGVRHGIRRDTAVVAAGGLVGRVLRSGATSSQVELLNCSGAAVAVVAESSSLHGLAEGLGGNRMAIRFIPSRAHLLQGTLLLTNGADGVYPPGLPVARVTSVREEAGPFLAVEAQPTADLAGLRVVLLLKGWSEGTREGRR